MTVYAHTAIAEQARALQSLGDMLEVFGDVLDRDSRFTVAGDPHHIVTELAGVGLGHSDILPARHLGKPSQMSPIRTADPCAFIDYLDFSLVVYVLIASRTADSPVPSAYRPFGGRLGGPTALSSVEDVHRTGDH
jgi:hypothetical protein